MIDDKYLFKLIKGETFHIVDQDGTASDLDPRLPDDVLIGMYRMMVQARAFDDKALKLQKGRQDGHISAAERPGGRTDRERLRISAGGLDGALVP